MPGHAVATAYAKALFALARERNQVDALAGELTTLSELVDAEPDLGRALAMPWVSAAAKRAIARETATAAGVSALSRDFLALVAARGRGEHLPAMAAAYRALSDQDRGVVRVRVRTAVPLGDEERATLAARLAHVLGGKQVVVEAVVDPALLGGFVAEVGSLIVDGSLDGQLARLRDRLAKG